MTYEEAISIVRCWVRSRGAYTDRATWQTNNEAAKLAIEAMEKQIPKKSYWECGGYHCKSCGLDISEDDAYCLLCGQAIDWSDDE